ncbi:putative carboxymuconolactone decarboxylase [Clostridium botulinum B str. Eklund 17B (NRP)]|uniref:Carboxymuconolactone decarboxylase n=1 Tax=Clostridium botulinum (strain Eklund 17B / Type B) TaxID=935198 RepID=B2TRI6_CLOBB|nr:carboxymuconolactone decarboxylase [Clostridium sp. ZBS18]ACD23106.1 putative carboxymuconolactone decarboxylase [Clostridium botulinum B str. Eklund 17B (NRP)]MCR1273007.1 carboxymuconolactone decarboxylase family protein [Clostridium botulinum]CDH91210.1 hypothetical protein CB17B2221 [Clostridium botulinum B str. Eklund 17B (NRP)]
MESTISEALSKYVPDGLKGYLVMRESIQNGYLAKKTRKLIFTILDSLDDEVSGAKSHAVATIDAGLTMEELVEAFVIVTIVKGINVLCKSGVEAIIKRKNDIEDKLVVCKDLNKYNKEQIRALVEFQERFFNSTIIMTY